MKKLFLLSCVSVLLFSCIAPKEKNKESSVEEVSSLIDNWHKNAAETNFEEYFNFIADDGIFIGTDATENWTKKEFIDFAKPYFDKGKAWDFTTLERNIYFSEDNNTVWFDELLNTQMKICRGSGVLVKTNNQWKIKHYVLSMTVPNDNVTEVVSAKSLIEDEIIKKMKK